MIEKSPDVLIDEVVIDEDAQHQFVRLLPKIQRQVQFRFRHLKPELREDRIAEAVAQAYEMYVQLVRNHRGEFACPTPLADFAVRRVLDGRQCGTPLNRHDITSRYCQQQNGIRGRSLHQGDRNSENWQELVVEDRSAGPAEVATTRIDFRDWLSTLSQKNRQIAERLAAGETTQAVAREFQLTSGRISQLRRELQSAWNEFQERVPDTI